MVTYYYFYWMNCEIIHFYLTPCSSSLEYIYAESFNKHSLFECQKGLKTLIIKDKTKEKARDACQTQSEKTPCVFTCTQNA